MEEKSRAQELSVREISLIWKKQSCSPRSHRNIQIRLLVK